MDLDVLIQAVCAAGGVFVAVATLWVSFGPSTKPISALLSDTSPPRSAEGRNTPHGSPRKKRQTKDESDLPSGAKQEVLGRDSEQETDKLDDEVGGAELSPRQPSEISSSSSSEDVPGSAACQSMLASAMMESESSGVRHRIGGRGEEGEETKDHDEWVIVGEGQTAPAAEQ